METIMPAMTKKQRVRAALAGDPVDHPPVSLWGHDFLREWTPEDLVANTLDAYRPYDWDFIKFNPRATYFAEAWGMQFDPPSDQRQPRPRGVPITQPSQLRDLRPVDAKDGVFDEHLRALSMLIRELNEDIDVLHTIFSPLSVVGFLCGTPAQLIEMAKSDGKAAHAAIAAVTETLVAYARASLDRGAAGIFYAPLTWASRDTCEDAFYAEFGRPYDLQVLAAVDGADFNVLHVCRNHNMVDALIDYPVAAFNWADRGEGNPPLEEVRSRTKRAVMGGVDQTQIHKMSAGDVKSQAREAMSKNGAGVFITAGCAIPPDTPAENRRAVAEAVRGS
jgi:uroporphyrinogen decarboxylase